MVLMSQAKREEEVSSRNLGTTLEDQVRNKWYRERKNGVWRLSKKSVGSEAQQKFLEKEVLVNKTTLKKLSECGCLGSENLQRLSK